MEGSKICGERGRGLSVLGKGREVNTKRRKMGETEDLLPKTGVMLVGGPSGQFDE